MDQSERMAFTVRDDRRVVFVSGTVAEVGPGWLTLALTGGSTRMLRLTKDTAWGTERWPTAPSEVAPGVEVVAVGEERDGVDVASRVAARPSPAGRRKDQDVEIAGTPAAAPGT